jgi:hypothetical protein
MTDSNESLIDCPMCERKNSAQSNYYQCWRHDIKCSVCGFKSYNPILGEPPSVEATPAQLPKEKVSGLLDLKTDKIRIPVNDGTFEQWCESVKDCGHTVQPNSATARQRKLGWDAAMDRSKTGIKQVNTIPVGSEMLIDNPSDDPMATRCGHNFEASECPYRHCGYKALIQIAKGEQQREISVVDDGHLKRIKEVRKIFLKAFRDDTEGIILPGVLTRINRALKAIKPYINSDVEIPEVCEGGCAEPVVGHDCEGVPLCQGCIDVLKKEYQALSEVGGENG